MARLAAVSSAAPSIQEALMRSRLDQARREADQAQAYADDLRQQLDSQEQLALQARGRVQNLEQGVRSSPSQPATSSDRPTETSVSRSATLPTSEEPTYLNTLGAVFKAAQPILAADLSSQQKNVVKSGLFEAANTRWSAQAVSTPVARRYAPQAEVTPPPATGRLFNQAV